MTTETLTAQKIMIERSNVSLAISNGEKTYISMNTKCRRYVEEDPAIRRHGEPQVVRVKADSYLVKSYHIDIFLVCDSSNLSENFEVLMAGAPTICTVDRHVDEHFTG